MEPTIIKPISQYKEWLSRMTASRATQAVSLQYCGSDMYFRLVEARLTSQNIVVVSGDKAGNLKPDGHVSFSAYSFPADLPMIFPPFEYMPQTPQRNPFIVVEDIKV